MSTTLVEGAPAGRGPDTARSRDFRGRGVTLLRCRTPVTEGSGSSALSWRRGSATRHPAGDGHVRPRRRHVVHERVDLVGGSRPGHDRQRRPGTIALEALVSAAFILIGGKIGDLIGRRRAYVLGLLGYAVGGLGDDRRSEPHRDGHLLGAVGRPRASLLLPAMQSLIHGNFEGPAQRKVYALVGASAAIAAAIGPLLGGFITTYLSAPGVPARGRDHRGRAVRHQARPRRALYRAEGGRYRRSIPRSSAWGLVLGISWQEGADTSVPPGARRHRPGFVRFLAGPTETAGEADAPRSDLLRSKVFRLGSRRRCSSRSGSAAR